MKGVVCLFHMIPEDAGLMAIRLLIAAILGGLVGLERETKGHPAGFRTHLLVSIGACLMMLLSLYGFDRFIQLHPHVVRVDPGRLPSYVVSGIGFLGAGTILVHGITVKGLTTAASIWVVAGIGLVVGDGMYFVAVLTTAIVILSLLFLNKIENLWIQSPRSFKLNIVVENKAIPLSEVVRMAEELNMAVDKIDVQDYPNQGDTDMIRYALSVFYSGRSLSVGVFDSFNQNPYVYKVFTSD